MAIETSPYIYDETLRQEVCSLVAGVDEAGRGTLAGPVVAASVILPSGVMIEGLRDSKRLSARQRESLFWEILCKAQDIGIGIVGAEEIDRINIYRATKKAMVMAVNDLIVPPGLLVIDAVSLPLSIRQISMPKAEDRSASVAAASIIAKVSRDRFMDYFHQLYPAYGFNIHRGYATKEHIRILQDHGPCPIHRKSFSPVSSPGLPF